MNWIKFLKYLKYIVIAACIIFIIWLWSAWQNEKSNADRWEQNTKQDSILSELILTVKDLRQDYSYFVDTINNIFDLRLKPKQIFNYTTINNSYSTDSSKTYNITPSGSLYPVNFDNGCLIYSGLFNSQDSTYTHLTGGYNSRVDILNYWQRKLLFPNWKRLQWIKRIKKENFRKVKNSCNNSVKIERLEIVKGNKLF